MIKNPIPMELRADHLFLLMGGNPLPNWVAARLLLKTSGQIYLLCSAGGHGSYENANRLSKVLQGLGCLNPIFIQIDNESNAAEIYTAVKKHVTAISSGQVGCNYTGGTKAMSVHAYRAIVDGVRAGLPVPIFSYVDARRQKVIFDPAPGSSDKRFYEVGLVDEAAIDLKTLFALHEDHTIKSSSADPTPPVLKDIIAELLRLCRIRNALSEFINWRMSCLKTGNKFKDEKVLAQIRLDETLTGSLISLYQKIAGGASTATLTLGQAAQNLGFSNAKAFAEWLDGRWLEDYTFECLNSIMGKSPFNHLTKDITILIKRSDLDFQIDVAAMRGYQLFAISCYSGRHRPTAKEHLIEIVTRAKQIGGDAARAALVYFGDDGRALEIELANQLDADDQVRVFDLNHMRDLTLSLQQWLSN